MAAGSTYTPLATTTLGSTATSYTFSSIPSTYTDLIVVISGKLTVDNNIAYQYNGDTGANYSRTRIYGTGSAAASTRSSGNADGIFSTGDGTVQSTWTGHIQNYANTTTYKTSLWRGSQDLPSATVSLWRSTAAINAIKLYPTGGTTWVVGTTFTLYGIAAA